MYQSSRRVDGAATNLVVALPSTEHAAKFVKQKMEQNSLDEAMLKKRTLKLAAIVKEKNIKIGDGSLIGMT